MRSYNYRRPLLLNPRHHIALDQIILICPYWTLMSILLQFFSIPSFNYGCSSRLCSSFHSHTPLHSFILSLNPNIATQLLLLLFNCRQLCSNFIDFIHPTITNNSVVSPSLWPRGIGSRLGRNRLWVRFLAVSDIYPMFIEPTITWVPSGFSGYIWLDTKIVFKKMSRI